MDEMMDAVEVELLEVVRDLPPREKELVLMLAKGFAKRQPDTCHGD